MKLGDIGEFGFIKRFANKFDDLIAQVDSGIGDDCAVVSINETDNHVITTDLLIEDVHFLKDRISPEELGYKSLAVNLSDIAAMGARPLYSFLSIGIPKNTDIDYLDRFMEGYHRLSKKYHTPLMGGDTTKSLDRLVINVAVIGQIAKNETRLRSMAQTNDLICVTGNLGDSGGGLKVLLDNLPLSDENSILVQRHHLPEPMINEGMWLARQAGVNAMMDISDGISSDLKHILNASGKTAKIEIDKLPVSQTLQAVGKKFNWNIYELAASAGEDYELLFTQNKRDFEKVNREFELKFNKPLHVIGEITDGAPGITWLKNGIKIQPDKMGFDHFR